MLKGYGACRSTLKMVLPFQKLKPYCNCDLVLSIYIYSKNGLWVECHSEVRDVGKYREEDEHS